LLAQTRARYESGEITATQAAQALGFSRSTLTKRITHKWFWRVRILRDPYSSKPYVLFYTTKRVGGGLQDFDAIKLLKFGAA
jgi:predicted phage gp36 major capsid-like protein